MNPAREVCLGARRVDSLAGLSGAPTRMPRGPIASLVYADRRCLRGI